MPKKQFAKKTKLPTTSGKNVKKKAKSKKMSKIFK